MILLKITAPSPHSLFRHLGHGSHLAPPDDPHTGAVSYEVRVRVHRLKHDYPSQTRRRHPGPPSPLSPPLPSSRRLHHGSKYPVKPKLEGAPPPSHHPGPLSQPPVFIEVLASIDCSLAPAFKTAMDVHYERGCHSAF